MENTIIQKLINEIISLALHLSDEDIKFNNITIKDQYSRKYKLTSIHQRSFFYQDNKPFNTKTLFFFEINNYDNIKDLCKYNLSIFDLLYI